MNKIVLIGRLTRDPELRYSAGNNPMAVARYGLAVPKKKKGENGEKADFFNVIAFAGIAEFAGKYLRKGMKIALTGHVQTGSYDKDGVKVPTFEIIAEEHEFCENKNVERQDDGFVPVPDGMDDELPFA